jgi:hypothetical protein
MIPVASWFSSSLASDMISKGVTVVVDAVVVAMGEDVPAVC